MMLGKCPGCDNFAFLTPIPGAPGPLTPENFFCSACHAEGRAVYRQPDLPPGLAVILKGGAEKQRTEV